MYYDRAGSVISEETWKAHWADSEYRMLARTDVGDWTVAAWWAGVDEVAPDRGRVFRTALLVPPRQAGYTSPLLQEWHHASADRAVAHHDDLVARLLNDDAPVPVSQAEAAHSCHRH